MPQRPTSRVPAKHACATACSKALIHKGRTSVLSLFPLSSFGFDFNYFPFSDDLKLTIIHSQKKKLTIIGSIISEATP
jgi:hypothetical protein